MSAPGRGAVQPALLRAATQAVRGWWRRRREPVYRRTLVDASVEAFAFSIGAAVLLGIGWPKEPVLWAAGAAVTAALHVRMCGVLREPAVGTPSVLPARIARDAPRRLASTTLQIAVVAAAFPVVERAAAQATHATSVSTADLARLAGFALVPLAVEALVRAVLAARRERRSGCEVWSAGAGSNAQVVLVPSLGRR